MCTQSPAPACGPGWGNAGSTAGLWLRCEPALESVLKGACSYPALHLKLRLTLFLLSKSFEKKKKQKAIFETASKWDSVTRSVTLPDPGEDAPHWYPCLHLASTELAGLRLRHPSQGGGLMCFASLSPPRAPKAHSPTGMPAGRVNSVLPLPLAASACFPLCFPQPFSMCCC